jgi:hypothetical protein
MLGEMFVVHEIDVARWSDGVQLSKNVDGDRKHHVPIILPRLQIPQAP